MSDYLRTISKVSNATVRKDIKVSNSIIKYYYYFNKLGDKVNGQMQMKMMDKSLNLLGNFKITYDKDNIVFNRIVFTSPTKMIIISGSFMRVDDMITYHKHTDVRIAVVDS